MNFNSAKNTKGRALLSNIPAFDLINSTTKNAMQLFDNNIRSFSTPEKSLESVSSYYQNGEAIQMNPSGNKGLYQFSIEFTIDEDYINYSTMCYWWKRVRSGMSTSEFYNDYVIAEANLWHLDNQKRDRFCEKLTNVVLIGLSGLTTQSAEDEEHTFTASFVSQHLDFVVKGQNGEVIDTKKEFDSN